MTNVAEMIRDAVDYHRAGDLDLAEEHYRRILDQEPENPCILHLLGALAHQKGRNDVALDLIERAISGDDGVAEFHNTAGVVLQALGRSEESAGEYRRAILLRPDYAEAYNNMAMVLQNQGRCLLAIQYYERAARLAPGCAEIYYNLANALRSEGRFDEAANSYGKALELKPDYAEAHNNLGMTLREMGCFEHAAECYRHAVRLSPDSAQFHSNLASILQRQGLLGEAIVHCERAVGLDPNSAEAHFNLGSALRDAGRCDEAIEQNELAIRLKPDYAEAHWNQAVACLLNGDFCRGWKEFEWRRKTDWHVSAYPHKHDKPRWNGESFVEKRLLIHCEQGVGDCLQFVRYLPMVKKLGGTVIFEAWKSLHGLLKDFDGIDELAETWHGLPARETRPGLPRAKPRGCLCHGQTQAQFDAHASIMDLPGVFTTTEHTIPRSVPYIHPDPIKSAFWIQELSRPELKVGIVWAGSVRHYNDRNRSCKLSHFGPLGQIEGVRLFGLQKGEPARQADGGWVTNLGERFDDFTDAAAAIANLDLVISVDTAVLHLAGAMGKPVWALLPFAPDWRWMLGRADSPWYPTMRLFRQKQWGDWDSVFTDVTRELRILVHRRKQGADR